MTENPLRFLTEYENRIRRAKSANLRYITRVSQHNAQEISEKCEEGNKEHIESSIFLGNNLDLIMEEIGNFKARINCEKLHPLWKEGIEDVVCTEGVHAIMWTFYSFIIVTICGMLIFSLRAARNDVEVTFEEEGDNGLESWEKGRGRNSMHHHKSGRVYPSIDNTDEYGEDGYPHHYHGRY